MFTGPRKDWSTAPQLTNVRDELANHELMIALLERGIARPGETIVNMPPEKAPHRLLDWKDCLKIDLSFTRPGDLLVETTRWPKNDRDHGDQKRVEPGNTKLERMVFRLLDKVAPVIARSHIRLSDELRAQLGSQLAGRGDMAFYQRLFGLYKQHNEGCGWEDVSHLGRTAVFLLRVDALWEDGPGLVSAFGMESHATLAWAYRLRRDLGHLLDEPGFHFYEIEPRGLPERPTDLRWAADWKVEPVLSVSKLD